MVSVGGRNEPAESIVSRFSLANVFFMLQVLKLSRFSVKTKTKVNVPLSEQDNQK